MSIKTTYDAVNALQAMADSSRYREYLYWDNSRGYYWGDSTKCSVSQLVCTKVEFVQMVSDLRNGDN